LSAWGIAWSAMASSLVMPLVWVSIEYQAAVRPGVVAAMASMRCPWWCLTLHRGGGEDVTGSRLSGDIEGGARILVALKGHLLEPLMGTQHAPAKVQGL